MVAVVAAAVADIAMLLTEARAVSGVALVAAAAAAYCWLLAEENAAYVCINVCVCVCVCVCVNVCVCARTSLSLSLSLSLLQRLWLAQGCFCQRLLIVKALPHSTTLGSLL